MDKVGRPARLAARVDIGARYIGTGNALQVVSQEYRWCRDKARALGVPIIKLGRKWLIPAAEFFEALERHAQAEGSKIEPRDATQEVLALLGWQVKP